MNSNSTIGLRFNWIGFKFHWRKMRWCKLMKKVLMISFWIWCWKIIIKNKNKMTPFHTSFLVNDLQFESVKMMTYDLWNLNFSHRNQFNRFLSLELIKVPSILRFFYNKPLKVAHHQKVLKLWRLPNIKIFTPNVNTSVPIFVHSYRFQKDKDG